MRDGAATTRPSLDDDGFAAFLEREVAGLRRFVARLAGPGSDADDVVQETLAKVWRLRAGFDPRGNGRAWLQQAAFRAFCDHRARRRRQPEPVGTGERGPGAEPACPTELRDELRHRLAALGDLERALLVGFHRDGRSLRELAATHDLPLNTVKSHLHRARQRLRRTQGEPQ